MVESRSGLVEPADPARLEQVKEFKPLLALLEKEWPEEYTRIARKLARDAGA